MDRKKLQDTQAWVRSELERSVQFWLKNGMDHQHGGVYTCLDRKGEIYSTDKSVWMQGRCGWTFAYLCHVYGVKQEWLDASKSCIDFMEKYCINREAGDRMYFTVTEDGKPLRQRRYCFSEGFYCMANAEYYGVTGDRACLERARRAYELIWQLNNGLIKDPTGLGPKTIPETRTGRALADPMIYLNITAVMRRCDSEQRELYDARAKECAEAIFKYHRKPEMHCTLESVDMDGNPELWYTAGRVVNPGHDIECSWFVMEQANHTGDKELHKKAEQVYVDMEKKYPDALEYVTFMRARVNSYMDPETKEGLAKPYYEKVMGMIEPRAEKSASDNARLVECYRYLGYYYLLKEDKATSTSYWNKILAIDPENEIARQALTLTTK